MSARALEFAIFTAARTGEVLGARWGEIDLDAKVWTVPAARMKAGREHRVPLSEASLAVLEAAYDLEQQSALPDPGPAEDRGGADVLLVDTAGRLHTKFNLMEELRKITRVLAKCDPNAPEVTLLVLDATTGQNALTQAREFQKTANVTGLVLAKIDGTAKGGCVFPIVRELKLPLLFLGSGEHIDDLEPFDAKAFVDALLQTR